MERGVDTMGLLHANLAQRGERRPHREAFRIVRLLTQPELERLRVVLVRTRNPLNIGAAARAMSNFGFSHLRVVQPYELAFREARSAVGAAAVLSNAEDYPALEDAIADCCLVVGTTAAGNRELQHPLRRLEQGTRVIRRQLASGRVALLFGSEKVGLSNEDLSHCQWLMRIPTREQHGSMNIGQAVAVCLYELVRDAKAEPPPKVQPARAADVQRFTNMLLDAARASGYLKSHSGAVAEQKLRRLVRRLNLPAQDAEVWLGVLRQILWKLSAKNEKAF